VCQRASKQLYRKIDTPTAQLRNTGRYAFGASPQVLHFCAPAAILQLPPAEVIHPVGLLDGAVAGLVVVVVVAAEELHQSNRHRCSLPNASLIEVYKYIHVDAPSTLRGINWQWSCDLGSLGRLCIQN
jgi:hypothetical protein